MLKQESHLPKIKELRDKLNQFTDPSEDFIKSIKKECENEGIDSALVVMSEKDFNTLVERKLIDNFKS
jgi:hypothetical protein